MKSSVQTNTNVQHFLNLRTIIFRVCFFFTKWYSVWQRYYKAYLMGIMYTCVYSCNVHEGFSGRKTTSCTVEFKICGGQFLWFAEILHYTGLHGLSILCIILYLQKKIWLYNPN